MTATIADLGPGLHPNVPPNVYHRRTLGVVSKSALDRVHRSAAHYKAWVDGTASDEETPALSFGRAFHCGLLEPERFAAEFVVEPDFGDCRKTDNKKARKEWCDEHEGVERLDADGQTAISGMVASVKRHPLAGKMIRDGQSELTMIWKDGDSGLLCKSRADYYVEKLAMVADVKSTLDASPDAFRKDIVKYRYHVQDALYRAGFGVLGVPVKYFVFIAVEKVPPYAVAVYSLDSEGIGKGYTYARREIDLLAECVGKDAWPAYHSDIRTIELPPWA